MATDHKLPDETYLRAAYNQWLVTSKHKMTFAEYIEEQVKLQAQNNSAEKNADTGGHERTDAVEIRKRRRADWYTGGNS